ncbi:MAG: hypothetical protein WBA97_23635 [Actinophytocola sp.]|uniref:hypothetical protein n=1 Tax=Actinophytocola sp. TaxID=1872138 RepID=UPI003C783EF6
MIVVPRLLTSVLRDADGLHAKLLSLAFAEHALLAGDGVVSPVHLSHALGYIAAAREFVEGKVDLAALGRAHSEYFANRTGRDTQSEKVTWIAAVAVSVACQTRIRE